MQLSRRGWGTRAGSAWGRDRFRRTLQQPSASGKGLGGRFSKKILLSFTVGLGWRVRDNRLELKKQAWLDVSNPFFTMRAVKRSGTDFVFLTLSGVQNLTGWNSEMPEQMTLLWVGDWNRDCSRSLPAWMILWSSDSITSSKSDLHIFICKKLDLESTLI